MKANTAPDEMTRNTETETSTYKIIAELTAKVSERTGQSNSLCVTMFTETRFNSKEEQFSLMYSRLPVLTPHT